MASKPTRAQKSLLKTAREGLRSVTKAERLAHPDKFSKGGSYFVKATTKKITARTSFVTQTRWRDTQEGVSHSKAAKERAQGIRGYKTAASENIAGKVRATAERKRIERVLDRKGGAFNAARKQKYKPSKETLDGYETLKRKKLSGEFLGNEWFAMIDIANEVESDETIKRLRQS